MNLSQQYCSNATSQTCTQDSDCTSPGTCAPKAVTVLIGGMRLGGAAINSTGTATYCFNSSGTDPIGQTCTQNSNCTTAPYNQSCSSPYYYQRAVGHMFKLVIVVLKPASCAPMPATPIAPATILRTAPGLSSYYALDITDAQNPKLLWEFSHPFLGYSYSGPAVIHKWSNSTLVSGDQYYVMFLSGPTNPNGRQLDSRRPGLRPDT